MLFNAMFQIKSSTLRYWKYSHMHRRQKLVPVANARHKASPDIWRHHRDQTFKPVSSTQYCAVGSVAEVSMSVSLQQIVERTYIQHIVVAVSPSQLMRALSPCHFQWAELRHALCNRVVYCSDQVSRFSNRSNWLTPLSPFVCNRVALALT